MLGHLLKLFWIRKRSNALLLLEIFISFIVLFVVSLLAIIHFERKLQPLGFNYKDVYSINLDFLNRIDEMDEGTINESFDRTVLMIEELERMPEVIAVASVFPNPYGYAMSSSQLTFEGKEVVGKYCEMTDGAFEALEMEITQGRQFNETDDALDWAPLIINRIMSEELFDGEDPIGKTVDEFGGAKIVGVTEDFRYSGELSKPQPVFIRRKSLKDKDSGGILTLSVKVKPGTPVEFEERALRLTQKIAPDWAIGIKSLEQMRAAMLKLAYAPFLIGGLVAGFLMIMVFLGMVGVFWQSITSRTQEIGLRRALGSNKGVMYRQLLGEITLLTTIGCAIPALLALQLPVLGAFGALDPLNVLQSVIVSCLVMYILALFSGLYPAWLATRVQPSEALHYE